MDGVKKIGGLRDFTCNLAAFFQIPVPHNCKEHRRQIKIGMRSYLNGNDLKALKLF